MKRISTNLPVTIESSFEHAPGDVLESVRQQVEIGIFHLQTLFKMAKRSAESIGSTLDDEGGDLEEFLYDVRNTSDLGYAVTMSIWRAVSDLTELQRQNNQPNEIEASGENDLLTTGKPSIIALAVSNLLNNEFVPSAIKEALKDALTDLQNGSEQREVLKVESSKEYIAGILSDYKKVS